jgi:hypothetical protein
MDYDEIPQHISQFISRAMYNRSSSEIKQALIENAYEAFEKQRDRVVFAAEASNNPPDYEMFTSKIIREVANIRRIQYVLKEQCESPSRADFVSIITNAVKQMHAINVVLYYIDDHDYPRWISFSQADINRLGLEQCVHGIETGVVQWDPDMYHGSNTVTSHIMHSTLSLDTFCIVVPKTPQGGGRGRQYVNYTTLGIDSNNNDCLIECFKYFKDIAYNNKTIRKKIGADQGVKLGLQHVSKLEELFKINVKIVEDIIQPKITHKRSGENKVTMTAKVIHGKGRNCILYDENHFDVIIKRKYKQKDINEPLEEEQEVEPKDAYYYFFDYETTYNPQTLELEPYISCVLKYNSKCELLETHVGTESISTLLNTTEKCFIIGFNNSRFDNFIFIDDLVTHDHYVNNVLIANNSFLSFTVNGCISRDLCRILCCSLKSACESFKCSMSKLEFDHATMQQQRNLNRLDDYLEQNKEAISEYVSMDCYALAELFFKTKDAVKQLTGLDIESHPTLGSLTYNAFKKTLSPKIKLPIVKDEVVDDFIRSSIIGGRTQIQKGECNDISSIDVTSLYPYVMLENKYPIGQPKITKHYMRNKIGVYNVTILSQPTPNIIPNRDKDGRLNWEYKGVIERVLNSVDIECLIRYGSVIHIGKGYYWEDSQNNIFNEYFDKLMQEKKIQDQYKMQKDERYNPALRELCKLDMNALSGKLAQRRYQKVSMFLQSNKQRISFENKVVKESIKYYVGEKYIIAEGEKIRQTSNNPVIWGSLIYAYARTYMYDKVLCKVKVYGMDTDSAFIKSSDIPLLGDVYGDSFGKFKIETEHHDAILIAPKCYIFYKNDEIIKQRFKGINTSKDKVIEQQLTDINAIHDYYFNDDNHIGIQTYQTMLTKNINILTSSLNKRIHASNKLPLSLMQRFSVKHTLDLLT